jgi:hypothetical protein
MASSYSIYTQEPPAPEPNTDLEARRRRLASGLGVGLMVLIGVLVWWVWPSHPPSPSGDPRSVMTFVASDRFNKLTTDQKQVYVDRIWELRDSHLGLTEEQTRAMRENAGVARFEKRLDDYFARPPGKARQDYLNQMMREQMARWATSRPTTRPGGATARAGAGRGWAPNESRMKSRLEASNPSRRAQMAEFFADMRAQFGAGMGPGRGAAAGR